MSDCTVNPVEKQEGLTVGTSISLANLIRPWSAGSQQRSRDRHYDKAFAKIRWKPRNLPSVESIRNRRPYRGGYELPRPSTTPSISVSPGHPCTHAFQISSQSSSSFVSPDRRLFLSIFGRDLIATLRTCANLREITVRRPKIYILSRSHSSSRVRFYPPSTSNTPSS